MYSSKVIVILLLAYVLHTPAMLYAVENNEDLQLHGFFSQAYIASDKNNFFGQSSGNGNFEYRELGINASYRIVNDLRVSAQVLSREAGKVSDGDPHVEYALADYRLIDNPSLNGGVRLGRVKLPVGIYNETRDVAHTRPGVLMPQSVYISALRDMLLAGDGGSLYMNSSSSLGRAGFSYHAGDPVFQEHGKKEFEYIIMSVDDPGEFEERPFKVFRFDYTSPGDLIRLAWTKALVDFVFRPAPTSFIPNGLIGIEANIYSLQLITEYVDFTYERMINEIMLNNFTPVVADRVGYSDRHYLQIDYRFKENWNGYVRHDVTYKNSADRDGRKYEQQTGNPAHTQFAIDKTIGLRWSYSTNLLIGMEYHMIEGGAFLSIQENPDPSRISKDWELFIVQVAYQF